MAQVTYRGKVEALQGSVWAVPDSVIQASQAGAWIESQAREQEARAVAAAEAERRQQELLAARLEQQRAAAANTVESAPISREELKAELRDELDVLAQNVMSAGAAIVGRGEAEAAARAEWEGRHESLLAKQEETAAVAADQVVAAQAASQSAVERVAAELSELRERNAELERELRQTVSTLRGPQGETGERGLAGSGIGYVDADPTRIEQGSLGQRFYGRPVVPGDILLQRTPDALLVWRTADGKTWAKVDEIINKQELVSQPISVLDASTKVTTTQSIQRTGGGAGGGGEVLLTDRASQSWVTISDASNWSAAGFFDPTAGKLMLELTDLADARRGVVTLDFSAGLMPGQTALTESAMTGAIFNDPATAPDVDFDVVRTGAPIIPAGVTGTPILTGGATQVRVRIGANLGGTKQYAIAGSVWWTRKAEGKIANPDDVTRQPLWSWQ